MNCEICHRELSIRDTIVIYKENRYKCVACPPRKQAIIDAYIEFCKILQTNCTTTSPELNSAMEKAYEAKEAALSAIVFD